jgi:outer membrane receptor for ferrienterochelin and colicins
MNRNYIKCMVITCGLMAPLASVRAEEDTFSDVSLEDLLNFTVEVASRTAEPLSEAPVPISVVTSQMIDNSGARTLHEALILFVPGYTDADDRNETTFATRGLYGTAQQKVLVMVNGHRINSRSYLAAVPDYGIALHNVERIEVLRGPGSSLYGNVSLAGVINLVLKKGKDFDKTQVEVAAGNHSQKRFRMAIGSGDDDSDVLLWGQFYQTPGEVVNASELKHASSNSGVIRIDGANDRPAHDFGLQYHRGNMQLFAATRHSRSMEPLGSGNTPIDYDSHRTFLGYGPGISVQMNHLGVKFDGSFGEGWDWSLNPYYDSTDLGGILATGNGLKDKTRGDGIIFNWNDQNWGAVSVVSKSYGANGSNVMFGLQSETFQVYDSIQILQVDGDFLDSSVVIDGTGRLLALGSETSHSAFFQNKHKFNDQWISSVGFRYDAKKRHTTEDRNNFSPRLAVIYLPNKQMEFKLSYTSSFVDSPYWYRYSGLPAFAGSVNTDPELLNSLQFQYVWKSSTIPLRNSTVIYNQKGLDFLVLRPNAVGTVNDPRYVNSGEVNSVGLENELQYTGKQYSVSWNFHYYNAKDDIDYHREGSEFAHVPQITSTINLARSIGDSWTLNSSLKYLSDQYYKIGTQRVDVDSAFIANIGARYKKSGAKGFYGDIKVYNAFDEEHYQGGQSEQTKPFRQAGLWFLLSVGKDW